MTEPKLAAIVYEVGTGRAADALLTELAGILRARGVRLAGIVQRAAERADRCACDMIVTDLRSGESRSISEDRGPHARGCRLDSAVLEAFVGSTMTALDAGADLLIVNKFGKQEAEGAGFRNALGSALTHGVPALVAVNRSYLADWRAFAGELGSELAVDAAAVADWCAGAVSP